MHCQAPCDPPCGLLAECRGLCNGHYERQRRGGTIDSPLKGHRTAYVRSDGIGIVPLANGEIVLVDATDVPLLQGKQWNRGRTGSRHVQAANPGGNLHSLLLPGAGRIVHVDGDTLNCQRSNLREAKPLEIPRTRRKTIRPTSSQYTGVSWNKARRHLIVKVTDFDVAVVGPPLARREHATLPSSLPGQSIGSTSHLEHSVRSRSHGLGLGPLLPPLRRLRHRYQVGNPRSPDLHPPACGRHAPSGELLRIVERRRPREAPGRPRRQYV